VDVTLVYSRYKWITVIDDFKFELNDIMSSNTKNDTERRRFVSPVKIF